MEIKEIAICDIKPYEYNPRNNLAAIGQVARSIKEFGFKVPLVIDKNNIIICGHTRYEAAKKLKLKTVPCILANDLSEEQVNAFRIIDNKTAEISTWDKELFNAELLKFNTFDFKPFKIEPFETRSNDENIEKNDTSFLHVKKERRIYKFGNFFFISFLNIKGKINLVEFKHSPEFISYVVLQMTNYIQSTFKAKNDCCIICSPKRRTQTNNVAENVAMQCAKNTNITFYKDAISANNRARYNPDFTLNMEIKESTIILIDDILTTGHTIDKCISLFENKNIIVLIGLRNKY